LPRIRAGFEKITADIEAVILGMHAKADNPELLKAQELGLKIYSYPILFEQSKNKTLLLVVLMENNDYFNDFACNALP
jgi:UDP-N-acetylmuramate-alanine ligase